MKLETDERVSSRTEEKIRDSFRRWGYLQAQLDPLGRLTPLSYPDLDVSGEVAESFRRFYSGPVGVEFMHILSPERRRWIEEKMEGDPSQPDRERILDLLIRGELFEQVLQARYIGSKRFSLEGAIALLPLLEEMLEGAATRDCRQVVLAMSHRGRLNVMVHTVGRWPHEVFVGFEDVNPKSVLGGGDVKYHLGATGDYIARNNQKIRIHLVSNPSHLEAVDPVALGRVRAKQAHLGDDGQAKILPILLHGDAAFAGQGILAETLNFAELRGYSVGGAIHVIVNNMIGFTTEPQDLHSSRFASDVAKRISVPIFHVNAEEPDAVVRVGRLALEYRYEFKSDVVIDLIGYRKHGHSEVDDPTITQPLLYQKIKERPALWESYAEQIGAQTGNLLEEIRSEFEEGQRKAKETDQMPVLRQLPAYWSDFKGGRYDPSYEVNTGISKEELQEVSDKLNSYPEDFAVHPKVKKLLEHRLEMGRGERPVDFGMSESLAFGSLLLQGVPVRLSGQDSRRGTFNQRHSVLIDIETEEEYIPLCHLDEDQANFEVYDSMLSEAAVLGFEYGYSRDYPDALVIWEAQFGDFANGAQVIIDQFISAAEDKWDLLSGVVMCLPHGHEGQGPEHSSARIERFLQLAAEDNIQVCQPSTAAQYFHLLRRQAVRKWRKPLVIFTPKSMLRHPAATSAREEFSRERFLTVIPDEEIKDANRVLVCSGKIGHELRAERAQRQDTSTAIVFIDQMYPFPEMELRSELQRHAEATEVLWVQEEPANMGALSFVFPKLERLAGERRVHSVKRSASASPATGSAKAHAVEQTTLLALAFAGAGK
ncbi:MAG: 2-oxoglutarate dehydrogenase E1 component [Acidobacteriota bacterium]